MPEDRNAPVIVAAAQHTWREPDPQMTPLDALTTVAQAALHDSGCRALADAIDTLATVRFITDSDPNLVAMMPRNPGALVAQRLGLENFTCFQTGIGGNTPQYLVNHFAARLAAGDARAVLISGAELLNTFFYALRTGADLSAWSGEEAASPTMPGEERDGTSAVERAHGLFEPVNTYPLFENALQHHLGRTRAEHTAVMAELCSAMSAVAASNPHAWKMKACAPDDIATVNERNRYIGYPYTRAMNAILSVDMAAAVVLTTAGTARDLGIDPSQMVYLRAGADVHDIWCVSEREKLYEAPAVGLAVATALEQSGLSLDEIDLFDIYSCFPSAVQIACNEIGLSPLDPRGVTVTGGLPYFGGPGNNYSLHAIAEMIGRLRGGTRRHGLVTANGYYLTKHSVGLYSTEPGTVDWRPVDSAALQRHIDALPTLSMADDPAGAVTIDSYTVAYDKGGPARGIVIGRNARGERVLADTDSQGTMEQLLAADPIGRQGTVTPVGDTNRFEF
jgi:acetyl-CoA C-acetyltransferase